MIRTAGARGRREPKPRKYGKVTGSGAEPAASLSLLESTELKLKHTVITCRVLTYTSYFRGHIRRPGLVVIESIGRHTEPELSPARLSHRRRARG